MRLALIQEKQNCLYNFAAIGGKRQFSYNEAAALQSRMLEQNFTLMGEAAAHAEFIMTSEAVNFPGQQQKLSFPAVDLVSRTYYQLRERLTRLAQERGVWVAAGMYRPLSGGVMCNSILIINRHGEMVTVYDKMHLAGDEQDALTAGDSFCCFDSEFGRMGMCICWDMQFPETCRVLMLRGARIVLCPTWGWEHIYAACRAYENGIYVAGAMAVPCNRPITGIRSPSSVINPEGVIVAQAGGEKEEIVYCDIDLERQWDIHRIRMMDRRPELYGGMIA